MHDAKGRELKVGDQVVLIGKITLVSPEEGYCNCQVESGYGRRPDGLREYLHAINTGVLLRANPGEDGDSLFGDLPADNSPGTPVVITKVSTDTLGVSDD